MVGLGPRQSRLPAACSYLRLGGVVTWEILYCRIIVGKFSFCRKIFVQKCKIWGQETFFEKLRGKIKILCTHNLLRRKFAAVSRKIATSCPAYILFTHAATSISSFVKAEYLNNRCLWCCLAFLDTFVLSMLRPTSALPLCPVAVSHVSSCVLSVWVCGAGLYFDSRATFLHFL